MAEELSMRYGVNPHQASARCSSRGAMPLRVLNDSPSYINLMDALNSWQLVRELRTACNLPAAASFKHVSPAGAAVGVPLNDALRKALFVPADIGDVDLSPLAAAYVRARGADRMASYGDWIAMSDRVDVSAAQVIATETSDGIIAPAYDADALAILKNKKGGKYRILAIDPDYEPDIAETRQIFGLTLEQHRNDFVPDRAFFDNVVTVRQELGDDAIRDLTIATITVKYTQSNSVCLALDGQVVGVGAGQQSRVHCVRLASDKADLWNLRQHPRVVGGLKFRKGIRRAERDNAIDLFLQDEISEVERAPWLASFGEEPQQLTREEKRTWLNELHGVALSSDAFFPFRDNIDRASRSGVEYLVQAGGSIMDNQVIEAADEYNMLMVHSGIRLFHH